MNEQELKARILTLESEVQRLRHLAALDPLTGLRNRSGLLAAIETALEQGSRHGLETSLLMLDLDDFKEINDRLGHLQGDRVLCLVAATLKGLTRNLDHVFRFGGDEFLVVCPGTGSAGRESLARRIQQGLKVLDQTPAPVQASIGQATAPPGAGRQQARTLLQAVDQALLQEKAKRQSEAQQVS